MCPTIRHKYKYFHSAVQRAKDRRQSFIFAICRLTYDHVTSNLISLIFNVKNHQCLPHITLPIQRGCLVNKYNYQCQASGGGGGMAVHRAGI